MRQLAFGRLPCLLLAGFILSCWSQTGRAAEPERVRFATFDEVEIHGTYFPGDAGNNSPCALLLHALGGSSREEGWDSLAKVFQKKHFAVLLFDFRGHGESTSVTPNFWTVPGNQALRGYKPGKPKDQISYKDFVTQQNWLSLVNDIEAAKRFLDRKNDSKDCNSSNLVVVGAESSAALGSLWIAWAWKHTRVQLTDTFPPVPVNRNQLEGQDIACAVWLSFSPHLAVDKTKMTLHPDSWLTQVRDKVPMCFLYGEQDTKAKTYALHLHDSVLRAKKDKKLKLTVETAIEKTKLSGRELLAKPSLDTEELILTYVSKVIADRGSNPWTERRADRTRLFRVPIESIR